MWGVTIAPAPTCTASVLRPQRRLLLLLRQRQQRDSPPTSARSSGTTRGRRGRAPPLSGPHVVVSMALPPLRAASASSSSPAAASGQSSYGEKISTLYSVRENDLLIIGPGALGRIVAEKWKQACFRPGIVVGQFQRLEWSHELHTAYINTENMDHPGCQTFGQTLTTDHHDELLKLGIKPLLSGSNVSQFPYVIFCAPPSRSVDYAADVRLAASKWSGEGSFLFTSSTAAYDCSDNGSCDEDSPVVPIGRSPRTDVILKAENVVMDAGGCVLRLAGLYKSDRGAHVYWLEKGIVETRPDHILNLIHYEDAASLSIAILKKPLRSQLFLGCDNHPLSRQEIMDCVNKSGKFDKVFQKFTGKHRASVYKF